MGTELERGSWGLRVQSKRPGGTQPLGKGVRGLSRSTKGPVCLCGGPEAALHCPFLFQGDTGAQGLPGPPGEDGERVSVAVRAGAGLGVQKAKIIDLFNVPFFSRVMTETLGPGGCLESR